MYLTQGLKRAVQVRGNEIATLDGTRIRTWRECCERVAKLAGALHALDVRDGERAAVLALNSDRYLEFLYATAWSGGVFVPVNTRLAPPEIAFWLNDSETSVLFVDETFAGVASSLTQEGKIPSVKHVVYMSDGSIPAGMLGYEDILATATPAEDADKGYEDLAGIFYTGGTTGRSKGVMLSHRNLVFNAFNCIATIKFGPESRWLHAAPMFHIADITGAFGITQVAGCHIFIPGFTPDGVLEAIEKHQITETILVPTMCNMVVNSPDIAKYDLSTLRYIVYGASPMPEAVIVKAMEVLPNCQFLHAYGQTECAPLVTICGPQYHVVEGPNAFKFRSVGHSVPGVEVRIVDECDKEVPRGTIGEIAVRGANVMLGYWRQSDLTDAALRGGWMHSGDGGFMDDGGFIYVVDRMKDMIISGGENVYSAEVENAIYQHPDVVECAVIGVPDDKWGERVHAIVRLRDGAKRNPTALIAHSHELIAGFKCPRSIEFRDDPMPLSGAGKILKTELRKPYWAGYEKQVS